MNTTVFLSSRCRRDLVLHVAPDQRVERRERFVEQQDLGIVGERAREADALLHAAGQLVGIAVATPLEPDEVEHVAARAVPLGLRLALHLEAERDVVEHAAVGAGRMLEHHRHRVAAELAEPSRQRR